MKISVVMPAKNESGAVGLTISKINELNLVDEVIVVNDGSSDNTQEVAEQAGAKVVTHPYSKGNGAAIKKGSQASVGRGIANSLYNNLASYMTEHTVEDLTSGFRAVRVDKFREFLYLLPNGFSYPTTSTMAFFRAGYSVTYVPIHAAKRIGKSHIQPMKDGVRFFLIIFKIATLFSPLKMFLPIAVILFLMATGWYGYTLYEFGRFTNMSALLYTGSVMIFLMGLISEQITALMYKDSK